MKKILIAGPCAAENELQLISTAEQLRALAQEANIEISYFRAGVWKPRSNPNSFCGVGEQALSWLQEVRRRMMNSDKSTPQSANADSSPKNCYAVISGALE